MIKSPLLIIFFLLFVLAAKAQDTTRVGTFKIQKKDTAKKIKVKFDTTMTYSQWSNLSRVGYLWNDLLLPAEHYYYISAKAGIGIPISNFSSTTYLGKGGYAKPGPEAELCFGFPIKPDSRFGIGFKLGYNNNPFNVSAYNNSMAPYQGEQSNLTSTSYQSYEALIGLVMVLNRHSSFNTYFNVSVTAGPLFLTSPVVTSAITPIVTKPEGIAFESGSSHTTVFVYDIALVVERPLGRKFYLLLKSDFISNYFAKADPTGTIAEAKTPIAIINCVLGIAYTLN